MPLSRRVVSQVASATAEEPPDEVRGQDRFHWLAVKIWFNDDNAEFNDRWWWLINDGWWSWLMMMMINDESMVNHDILIKVNLTVNIFPTIVDVLVNYG